jgi:hypothetical protein
MWVIELAAAVKRSLIALPEKELGEVWLFVELLGVKGPWLEPYTRRLGGQEYELSFPCGLASYGELTYRVAPDQRITLLRLQIRPSIQLRQRAGGGATVVVRLLSQLGLLLPASERQRFVAEELGNLGDCMSWWERANHLLGLALGMPRLVWVMRPRKGRRRWSANR